MKTMLLSCLLLLGTSCVVGREGSKARIFDAATPPLALRSMQSRVFDTTDRTQTLRTVVATLQDLDFLIEDADNDLGTVAARKVSNTELRLMVTVRPRGERQTLVRVNGQFGRRPLTDPEAYQAFFSSLEKAMFLTAQQVDGG